MITTYLLGPARLKIAIEHYMASIGKPVTDADTFTVGPDGTVTVVITEPDKTATSIPIPASTLPVAAFLAAGHMVVANPPFSATGIDTEFGYKDPGDNGIGFFIDPATSEPYDTNNKDLVGISLPREVLLSTFGISDDWRTEETLTVWKKFATTVQILARSFKITANVDGGGKSLRGIPLVDVGPTRTTGNLVDLTDAAAIALGTGGKAVCTFELLKNGVPMELKGIDFAKGIVG
jgi:hypothetical protein